MTPLQETLWGIADILMIGCVIATGWFLFQWYGGLLLTWPKANKFLVVKGLFAVPFVALVIILYTVANHAAPSVTEDGFFIFFYVTLGMPFVFVQVKLMEIFWDISWRDDLLNANNKAAFFPVLSAVISTAILYASMNVGDGYGWWCVLVPFGMIWGLWFLLAMLLCIFAKISERITVGRETFTGIRFGIYLLLSTVVIAQINMGDWISFNDTVIEFIESWPVILLAAVYLWVERAVYKHAPAFS